MKFNIKEGTDQYSLFRIFSIIMLFVIAFSMLWDIHEIRINRATGYHNRAVSCASVKGTINELAFQHTNDPYLDRVFKAECTNNQVSELYNNANDATK